MSVHTILVVEDNTATRKMVCHALSERGHKVLEAADGATALEVMEREQPLLVLQDVILPDMDGFVLVEQLRRRARDQVVILAFSGFRSRSDEARLSAVGFDDVIIKPIEPSRLIPIVEAHLPAPASASDRFGTGRRLVLADDDPLQLKLTAYRLEKLGFNVRTASDGKQAMELLLASPPDAVVSDVLMPNLDGFGLALAVRQEPKLSRLPMLLVTSSYVDDGDRDFARRAGASDLVLRTPEHREMIGALRALFSDPPAAPPLEVATLPELERERATRVLRQLERHVAMNAGLARRCSSLAAELAVLTGISDAVLKNQNVEVALDAALSACFDAGGISVGGLYLLNADGSMRVRPLGTRAEWGAGALESFFGQLPLLRQMIGAGTPSVLPAATFTGDSALAEMLRWGGGGRVIVVPLVHLERPLGALFMVAEGGEPEEDDWMVFAQGVANQIAQALALAGAFSQMEAAERGALESRAEWRALAEHAPDIIVRVDRQGVVQFINRVMPPWSPDELLGKQWLGPVPAEYHQELSEAFERVMTTGEPSSHEIMLPAVDSRTEWFSSRIGPIQTRGEITGAIIISRHITEKKKEDAQLIASDRMATVGTLAAGVAHEINNPLAAVIANLDLAQREAVLMAERSGNRELVEYLQDAQEAAERVRLIVRDLKVFSRAEEDRMGPTDVRSVLESTLRMAWNEIRHRARLVKDFGHLPPVEANESRLGQVFLNLILNAAHAIPEGNAQHHEIRVAAGMEPDGMVAIAVTDTGVGMSDDIKRRLFTPFFTTKPAGVGTGLGLSICQRLIAAMGGSIRVESKVGEGSTFTVLLPVAKSFSPVPVPAPDISTGPVARRRGSVLVIDDEEVVAMAIRRSLTREHDVVHTSTAQEALQRLRAGENFDVILCDLMMPEMTGMDLHAELLLFSPEQARRIIFVTGGAFTARARDFLEAVPNLRVEKPFNLQQLRALVNERIR